MTRVTTLLLESFKAEATRAGSVETKFREQAARQITLLERERTFAFRRFNLMSAVADAAAQAENEDAAVENALAVLRAKLGWGTDSDGRAEVLVRFAPVGLAIYQSMAPEHEKPVEQVQTALGIFEAWYAETHPAPFWTLFDLYTSETPRVDF
jgi:hypothetical protein